MQPPTRHCLWSLFAAGLALVFIGPDITAWAQRPAEARTAQAHPAALVATPSLGPLLSDSERGRLAAAYSALEAGRRDEARALVATTSHALAAKVFQWLDMLQPRSGAMFQDIVRFIEANPDWPANDGLRRRAEEALGDGADDASVLAWFEHRPPLTADGALRFAEALGNAGQSGRAAEVVRGAWISLAFGPQQQKDALRRFGNLLSSREHAARLDRLLWENRRDEARRILPLVDAGWRALAEARMALAAVDGGAERALRRVPTQLANDPGLIYERTRWRRRKDLDDGALELLLRAPKELGRPEAWWTERSIIARRLLAAGRANDAYRIVRDHRLTGTSQLIEAEFLAGWIALRRLGDAGRALGHFSNLHQAGRFPVTQARGAYWAGRAAEALGQQATAIDWYRRAAALPVTYYGQLARARLGPGENASWPPTPTATPDERAAFHRNELTLVARTLHEIGAAERAKPFFTRLVQIARTPGEHALVGELALGLGRPDLAVSTAKRSAQLAGVMLLEHGWPVVAMPSGEAPEEPLVLATIRQESAFEVDAISRAGARGLMQLLPATARGMARELGLASNLGADRLTSDPALNIRLGRAYLQRQIDDFGGSYILALAAYNAGPARARAWARDFGDPRDPSVDAVDWIETIPFDETRNYVQRVLESLQVYRHRLGQNPDGRTIAQDLR